MNNNYTTLIKIISTFVTEINMQIKQNGIVRNMVTITKPLHAIVLFRVVTVSLVRTIMKLPLHDKVSFHVVKRTCSEDCLGVRACI